jgi:prepilin signal peptidase PulO-like enzyme (type II secretory pathway)
MQLIVFFLGFLIPILSQRMIKVWYYDAGTTWALMLSWPKLIFRKKLLRLWGLRLLACCAWGVFALLFVAVTPLPFPLWHACFFCLSGVLLLVDHQTELLPDVLTVPLLITGFCYGTLVGGYAGDSALGAAFGYLLPALSAFVMFKFYRNEIGGGDVKMLAAVGAWLGVIGLAAAVLLSAAIFCLQALAYRKKRFAYGPAIVIASLLVFAAQAQPWYRTAVEYLP